MPPTGPPAAAPRIPVDQATRDLVSRDGLGRTLFVEAGAGSGKTRGLVERIGALVLSGRARIDEIAAITFTEAAAAELRDRIAAMLEEAATEGVGGSSRASATAATAAAGNEPSRAREALEGLDGAAITTLHGFCRRILAEHPFEAGVLPVDGTPGHLGGGVQARQGAANELELVRALERHGRP